MQLLVAFALVGLATGGVVKDTDASFDSPVETDYHNKIGIPLATQLKAAEEPMLVSAQIVDGKAASFGQYPFIGGLIITLTNGETSVCGSSLLTHTRGVTAAHCWRTQLAQARSFTVVYGSTFLFSGGTRVITNDVEMHADYNMNTLVNDIAIIRLPWIRFTDNIRPIALATGRNDFAGTWAWAAGWGRTSDNGFIIINQYLLHVQVQVITNAVCQYTYGSNIQASTLCVATTSGRGACYGDSGGPLTNSANNLLIGVASFVHGSSCAGGYPAGFARVSAFTAWLQARL